MCELRLPVKQENFLPKYLPPPFISCSLTTIQKKFTKVHSKTLCSTSGLARSQCLMACQKGGAEADSADESKLIQSFGRTIWSCLWQLSMLLPDWANSPLVYSPTGTIWHCMTIINVAGVVQSKIGNSGRADTVRLFHIPLAHLWVHLQPGWSVLYVLTKLPTSGHRQCPRSLRRKGSASWSA